MSTRSTEILALAYERASQNIKTPLVEDEEIVNRIDFVARNTRNRACIRFIMACALAKSDKPEVDIRKPYTEIGDPDVYSGRTYDEAYIGQFVQDHKLPCNSTTAWLTPAFRNRDQTMTPDINLVGRPTDVYRATLLLLNDVYEKHLSAEDLLAESIRWLLVFREEKRKRMESLLSELSRAKGETPLSAEDIVELIEAHLKVRGASRLPVLVVAAAYQAAQERLGERILPLQAHNAADLQTGSLGDLEITLIDDDQVITSYEMKAKRVTTLDIDHAVSKVASSKQIDNYIFITTDIIDQEVEDYARGIFDKAGFEVVVLDCIGFLRHFLHLFYRLRTDFLDAYQELVLAEPDSAVSQPLKEAFLSLRQATESAG